MIRRDNCLLEPRRSKTHLPSPVRQSKEGHDRYDPSLRAELIQNIDRRLRELTFNDSLCPVRKSMPSKRVVLELQDDDMLRRRGSVYQSSKEIRRMRNQLDQRRRFERNQGGEDFLSFEILNSSTLCRHIEDKKTAPSSNGSRNASNSVLHPASTNTMATTRRNPAEILDLSSRLLPDEQPSASGSDDYVRKDDKLDSLLEISLTEKDCLSSSRAASNLTAGGVDDNKASKRVEVRLLENDINSLPERDNKLQALPKSFSAKVELLSSLRPADDSAHRGDTKSRYSTLKRILDPIGKSKSQRNTSLLQSDGSSTRTDDPNNARGNNASVTPVSSNLSSIICDAENAEPVMLGKQGIAVVSPVHLKGVLKQENHQGVPYFEFFSKESDDVLTAKKWKTDSTLDWVYTFYTNKRKNNSAGRGVKDKNRCQLIGQMHASSHLCSEVGRNGSVDNSNVSEFVLYDIAQARRSIAAGERTQTSMQTINHLKVPDIDTTTAPLPGSNSSSGEKGNLPSRHGHDSEGDTSQLLPWATSKLLPHLEIAAIVVNIPFEKKIKMKDAKKNEICTKRNTGLSTLPTSDQCKNAIANSLESADVKVITSSARHGLPNVEGCPSPLLHRWRSGGGCDCGGWDMGCSITVLESNGADDSRDNICENLHRAFMLSVQGSKDSLPTFALTSHTEGYHSICFHAQLSSLQAFSIGVAMLHCLTFSALDALDKDMPIFHSSSLKLLLEEEVKQLLNVVAEDEKRKTKMVIEPMPPFSPIGRV